MRLCTCTLPAVLPAGTLAGRQRPHWKRQGAAAWSSLRPHPAAPRSAPAGCLTQRPPQKRLVGCPAAGAAACSSSIGWAVPVPWCFGCADTSSFRPRLKRTAAAHSLASAPFRAYSPVGQRQRVARKPWNHPLALGGPRSRVLPGSASDLGLPKWARTSPRPAGRTTPATSSSSTRSWARTWSASSRCCTRSASGGRCARRGARVAPGAQRTPSHGAPQIATKRHRWQQLAHAGRHSTLQPPTPALHCT